jgi:hypothetical protein
VRLRGQLAPTVRAGARVESDKKTGREHMPRVDVQQGSTRGWDRRPPSLHATPECTVCPREEGDGPTGDGLTRDGPMAHDIHLRDTGPPPPPRQGGGQGATKDGQARAVEPKQRSKAHAL